MTRLLALDTSIRSGGVALVERPAEGETPVTVAEVEIGGRDTRATRLIGWIEWVLAQAGWSKSSLDGFAATRGPGSFTGIRVALGTLRGLSLASGKPALGVTTLEAMAESYGPAEADRVPLLAAGRGEVYGARYDASSSPPAERHPAWVGPPELALATLTAGPTVVVGGAEITLEAAGEGVRLARAPGRLAAAAGRLALLRGFPESSAATSLAPLYVRPPDARVQGRP